MVTPEPSLPVVRTGQRVVVGDPHPETSDTQEVSVVPLVSHRPSSRERSSVPCHPLLHVRLPRTRLPHRHGQFRQGTRRVRDVRSLYLRNPGQEQESVGPHALTPPARGSVEDRPSSRVSNPHPSHTGPLPLHTLTSAPHPASVQNSPRTYSSSATVYLS